MRRPLVPKAQAKGDNVANAIFSAINLNQIPFQNSYTLETMSFFFLKRQVWGRNDKNTQN